MTIKGVGCKLAVGVLALVLSLAASAGEAWPSKSIKLVVPTPPGGGNDLVARTLAGPLGEALGTTVVVENRAGAATNLAMEYVGAQPADGYTLTLVIPTVVQNPVRFKLNFKPLEIMEPVARLTAYPVVLVARKDLPANDLKGLIAFAKSKPEGVTCAASGTLFALACEMLQQRAGVKVVRVTYKGSAPAKTDLIGGHVDIMFDMPNSALGPIEAGKTKALAKTSGALKMAPWDKVAEASATIPEMELNSWQGILAPRGLPPEISDKVQAAIQTALNDAKVQETLNQSGLFPSFENRVAFSTTLARDAKVFGDLLHSAGMAAK